MPVCFFILTFDLFQLMPQIRLMDLLYVDPVIADLAAADSIETVDQVLSGRLTRTGCTDKSNLLSGFCKQGNVMQDF